MSKVINYNISNLEFLSDKFYIFSGKQKLSLELKFCDIDGRGTHPKVEKQR